jgi:flagellar P-ring protein FlgI
MKRSAILLLAILILGNTLFSQSRIKDIARVENSFQVDLVGYGLVIGLNGTGDRASRTQGAVFTVQSVANMLERFGITVDQNQLRTRNAAAVMVTAQTPAFGRVGSRFDATVSSLGDASSLEGGILLMTPLLSRDGTYYASVQGPVSIGGYNIETMAGEMSRKNHSQVGRVPSGAILETASKGQVFDLNQPVRYILNEPDFVTASRVSDRINQAVSELSAVLANTPETWVARPLNAGVVEVTLPDSITRQEEAVFFLAGIETLLVETDIDARVVINERTGTIVAGGNVRINEVMISHGSLTIHIRRTPIISQPTAPFSNAGRTVVEYMTETTIQESEGNAAVLPNTTTVNELAAGLNELGLRPRDVIAIFQAIKQAGALNAKLIIM